MYTIINNDKFNERFYHCEDDSTWIEPYTYWWSFGSDVIGNYIRWKKCLLNSETIFKQNDGFNDWNYSFVAS